MILGVYLFPDTAKTSAKGSQVKHTSLTTTGFLFGKKTLQQLTLQVTILQQNFPYKLSRVTDPFHTLTFGNAISCYKVMS